MVGGYYSVTAVLPSSNFVCFRTALDSDSETLVSQPSMGEQTSGVIEQDTFHFEKEIFGLALKWL